MEACPLMLQQEVGGVSDDDVRDAIATLALACATLATLIRNEASMFTNPDTWQQAEATRENMVDLYKKITGEEADHA